MREIDTIAAESAFPDQHGDFRGVGRGAEGRGIDHHAGKPRGQWQLPQSLSFLGNAPVSVDGAEFRKQCPGFGQRRPRRRI
jgi:hypothetical protein